MTGFDEKVLEDHFIKSLKEMGWLHVPGRDLERDGFEEPLLIYDLKRTIERINKDQNLDEEEINQALNELKFKSSSIEGIKQILNFLKYGIPISSKRGRIVKRVKLFDFNNVDMNEFILSDQVIYQGKDEIRTDIILYVNGIPLVNIELKNPASFSETWHHAYKQIKEYEKRVPELYKYVQIGIAAEQIAKYFTIAPWQSEVRTYEWREGTNSPLDSILEILYRDNLLDIIQNYIFFREEFGVQTKVIARYMQYRAAEKIVDRVYGHLEGKESKNRGLIWHWQGSGKTLTMIFASNKLYNLKELENPSIFLIEDRLDLQDQLYQEYTALDIIKPEKVDTIDKLKRIIKHDDWKGKKGIFVLLIHKFNAEKFKELYSELKQISKKKDTISNRKNVIVFLDEAHRTQYGTMAGQMEAILKSAYFFGLTGTPFSKKDKDTYQKFSYPPEEQYLDRYFVTDSIKDGFTLKIVYQPRLEDVHLDKKVLQTLTEVEFEDLPENISGKVEEKVKRKLNAVNLFLENPERIDLVAEDISEHFKENVEGKYKAMIVTASRKACILYKNALDKYLPPEYSEVVMSYGRFDEEMIKYYENNLKSKYGGMDTEDIKKENLEKFKSDYYLPKILIVTDMLLTGFDAPILQTMYLDRPLREYVLLQAVARTNRPYKGVKEAGLIIDYVGIIKAELKRAFKVYSEDEYDGTLIDVEALRKEFDNLLNKTLKMFKNVPQHTYDMNVLLNAVEILTSDEKTAEEFEQDYRVLRRLFEFLGSDEIKLERLEDYKWVSAVYVYYSKVISREPEIDELVSKYFTKTIKYVHKTTEFEEFEKDLPIIEFDEKYLDNLESQVKNKEQKAANIVFALNKFVLVNINRNPVYESVADKVERILDLWRNENKDFDEIFLEGVEVVKIIEASEDRRKNLNFTKFQYAILLVLEKKFGKKKDLVLDVKELTNNLEEYIFPGWSTQRAMHKKVEREIRRFLRKKYYKSYLNTREDLTELHNEIVDKLENYAE